MKIRIAASVTLPVLLVAAALAAAPAARAQSVQPPPVTSGLWQSTATITRGSMPGMPARGPHATVTESCMSPDTWKNFGHPERLHSECAAANFHQDSHQIVMDETCKGDGGSMTKLHVEVFFDSAHSVHGTTQITMVIPSMPNPIVNTTKFESHFVSASCGSMKPGDVKRLN